MKYLCQLHRSHPIFSTGAILILRENLLNGDAICQPERFEEQNGKDKGIHEDSPTLIEIIENTQDVQKLHKKNATK